MPLLKNKFVKVAGSAVTAATLLAGPTVLAATYAPDSLGMAQKQHPVEDAYFNFMTPLFSAARYELSMADDALTLRSPLQNITTITANTPQAGIDQVVAGVKDTIIKNGATLNRIILVGDGAPDRIVDPLPNAACHSGLAVPEPVGFCGTTITGILKALVELQAQTFPGHKAGEPLAKAFDIRACDVLGTNIKGWKPLPAKEISQLAAQLNMPVIGSSTEVASYLKDAPKENPGRFLAMLPDGNVSYLPSPYYDFKENIASNEEWIRKDGFTIQAVIEPVPGFPYSLVNNDAIAAKPIVAQAQPHTPRLHTRFTIG